MFEELVVVEDSEDVRRLATFSPYHLVREGVAYPAVFLEAGDTDPRAPAWHARKFAARLQRASSGAAPVLLHVWENVGHGFATDRNIAVLQNAEWLAFTLQQLGVHDWQDLQDG
jgi:prolyl oligopeptidase